MSALKFVLPALLFVVIALGVWFLFLRAEDKNRYLEPFGLSSQRVSLSNRTSLPVSLNSRAEEVVFHVLGENIDPQFRNLKVLIVNEQQLAPMSWEADDGSQITFFSYEKTVENVGSQYNLIFTLQIGADVLRQYDWSDEQIETFVNLQLLSHLSVAFQQADGTTAPRVTEALKEYVAQGNRFLDFGRRE